MIFDDPGDSASATASELSEITMMKLTEGLMTDAQHHQPLGEMSASASGRRKSFTTVPPLLAIAK
jgi:hypothetical protein